MTYHLARVQHRRAPVVFPPEAAFGYARDFLDNQFVYLVISSRANGLAIGLNLNPAVKCNLDCRYCEVSRDQRTGDSELDIHRMSVELSETLELANGGWLHQWDRYAKLPLDLLHVRHVALSGDAEPTLSDSFVEATRAVVQVRDTGPFFKIVLVTNSTALDQSRVQQGLELLTERDEVWAKLDGGTQRYLNKVNGPAISLATILNNILLVARQRPVVIQSLFPEIDGEEPTDSEIQEYALRLKELKTAGAEISLVQIYSAARPMASPGCIHVPLKSLSRIARTVRKVANLRAEIF
jgi:wyosine [tRNA(Phe)-imidazoG37] synthetase (radical SAM superfamily)